MQPSIWSDTKLPVRVSRKKIAFNWAIVISALGRYSEAIDAFNKITDASGALSQEAWYHLGDCYLKTGEKTKALTAFEAASRSGSDAEIERAARYLFVKINYEVESPFEEVGRALRYYLDTYSPDEEKKREINALLANHYIDEKNYPKALEALREADPRNAELRAAHQKVAYYRGIQLINAGSMKEAQELFKESQSFAVSDQLLALAHFWTAEAHYRQKEFNKAIDSYRRFRESPGAAGTSEFILAVYDQAYAHYRLKEWETAAALFRSFNESYDLGRWGPFRCAHPGCGLLFHAVPIPRGLHALPGSF
jgi:TolA-binding protein